MKTNVLLWQYVAHLFLEREMFQTSFYKNSKHIFWSKTFFPKPCRLWNKVGKYCRARQNIYMSIWRMRNACWKTKVTNTHSEYIILIAFPQQQWLYESASILHDTYIACLVIFSYSRKMNYLQKLLGRQIRHCNYTCMYFSQITFNSNF